MDSETQWLMIVSVIIALLVWVVGMTQFDSRLQKHGRPIERKQAGNDERKTELAPEKNRKLRAEQGPTDTKPKATMDERGVIRSEQLDYLALPIPPDIQESMDAFLSGFFFGEEPSPLLYVGYRVGTTKGLPEWDRRRRLEVCFRSEIPDALCDKYRKWGPPASRQRFLCMINHLNMLADMRRKIANQRRAVLDWDADAAWFRSKFEGISLRFSKYGDPR